MHAYLDVNELNLKEGRGFTAADFLSGARVAVISNTMQEEMFDGKSSIGEVIRIGSQPVKIIGVLEKANWITSVWVSTGLLPFNTWKMVFGKSRCYSNYAAG